MQRPLHGLSSLCILACFSLGCAEVRVTELPPVGPRSLSATSSPGFLIVNSKRKEHSHYTGDVMYYPHTAYSVHSSEGRFLRYVENHLTETDEIASKVPLLPGKYFVTAESEADGAV